MQEKTFKSQEELLSLSKSAVYKSIDLNPSYEKLIKITQQKFLPF